MIKIMDSQSWKLQDADGNQAEVGQVVVDNSNRSFELTGGTPPHKPSSSGSVYGIWSDNGSNGGYFPTVFSLRWVEMGIRGSV